VLDVLGGRATWYRRQAADFKAAPPKKAPVRRGPQAHKIDPWERQVVETVARAFPWYGYKKIAVDPGPLSQIDAKIVRFRIVSK